MEYFIAAQLGVTYLWFKSRPLPPLKPLKKDLPENEEYFPLDKDLSKINWNHLKRLLAFNTGTSLSLKPEFIDSSKSNDLKRLDDVPDVLPFKLTADPGQINWETITSTEKANFLKLAEPL